MKSTALGVPSIAAHKISPWLVLCPRMGYQALGSTRRFFENISVRLVQELPCPSIEPHFSRLLDRLIIGGAGIERYSRKHPGEPHIMKVCCLTHQVLPREIVSALLKHVNQGCAKAQPATALPPGKYFFNQFRNSIVFGSSFQRGSVGSLEKVAEMIPIALSSPAGSNTAAMD
jgi:hypothetical protein